MSVALTIPMEHGLLLAAVLFSIGLLGVMVRRNIIFILMSLEITFNACDIVFILAHAHWGQTSRPHMSMLIPNVAASAVAVRLVLLFQCVS